MAPLEKQKILNFRWKGGLIATAILVAWALHLYVGLFVVVVEFRLATALSAMLLVAILACLNTGLFITAHDSMHGLVFPHHPRLNRIFGIIATRAYALFSYQKLQEEHGKHHFSPATDSDPDYHDGQRREFHQWLIRFLKHYMSWTQFAGLTVLLSCLHYVMQVRLENLVLFWAIPAWLSALQLFYFGTYLPHREPAGGYVDRHRARSSSFPEWFSFISCFHFGGFHYEHHVYPFVPWWKLPQTRKQGTEDH